MTMPHAARRRGNWLPESLPGFVGFACASAFVAILVLGSVLLGPALLRKARAERRAAQLEQRLQAEDLEGDAPGEARAQIEEQLQRVGASIPAERRDFDLIDQLRSAARRAGATNVLIAPAGGVQVAGAAPAQLPPRTMLLTREPSQLKTDLVTFSAEGRYADFVAFLGELGREPGVRSLEAISLARRPPRISWTLTLKAAHW